MWGTSVALIIVFFAVFDRRDYLKLAASLIGVSALLFTAKGNALGHVLMLVFSALYAAISYRVAYYGEMITYLGMTAPMCLLSLISWLRHPYAGKKSIVKINRIRPAEWGIAAVLTVAVTIAFFFILRAMGNASLWPSTISVTTSFFAAYLTLRRSPYYALAYAANDAVLLVLWIIAAVHTPSYWAVVACFVAFLAGDSYGFFNWLRMQKSQNQPDTSDAQ